MLNFQGVIYQPEGNIKIIQEKKLQELLLYLSSHSPFYQKLFAKHKIDLSKIKSLADLRFLPTTSKEDLQHYNDDFLCVSPGKVIDYTSTSGTLGRPVTIALTEKDLDRLAFNEYNSFLMADGSADDIYQLMLTLNRQFMAGIAYYSGIRKLGAGVIRMGPGLPSEQWETIHRLKPTTIIAVPSFILTLIRYAKDNNIDINSLTVKKAICIGENIRNPDCTLNVLGKKITDAWNLKLYSTYASTEMQTAFTECKEGCGGHFQPELLLVELLDENDQPVAPHVPGEVTITTLGVEGMPLLRYKTGDICMYFDEPCACGQTSLRLSPVIGRKKQMIKFKGTTLYPPAIYDILNEMEDIIDFVLEVHTSDVDLDEVSLYLLVVDKSEEMDSKIRDSLLARLRVSPYINYVTAEELHEMQSPYPNRKAIKFIDKRILS